ncbi:MAG TPA: carbon starvation CstA family protein [Phycisphaerales bacterium]
MSIAFVAVVAIVVLTLGYFVYGSFIARQYALDDNRTTPAVVKNDGVDFVPEKPFALLSQHFSAIAAAGPIAGPILACAAFGWLPCLLWIIIGVVLIGAVHDFSALVASIRHGAHSIAEIARQHLGKRAYLAMVAFIWLALLYVIVAFTQITADTFVGRAEELEGLSVTFNKGGAVAMASTLYLILALGLGVVQKLFKLPIWLVTVVFVPATLGCVWAGTRLDSVFNHPAQVWFVAILVYCFVASMLPMWLLQQPRGFLGGWVLYLAIGVGVIGVLFGGFTIRQPALTDSASAILNPLASFERVLDGNTAAAVGTMLFPFLFVTIACGACSGFHGLICGGTTSRQIAKESHCKPIGFGAMLLEGFVAVIALATIMKLAPEQSKGLPPARIYGDGLADFFGVIAGKDAVLFAATFGAMAFSTFVFDTLDVSARLGRYLLSELLGIKSWLGGTIAAGVTSGVPLAVLLTADPNGYRLYWTLFGTANQLLAAITLLGVSVWLYNHGKRCWFVVLPMLFVGVTTITALSLQIVSGFAAAAKTGQFLSAPSINAVVGVLLLSLAAYLVVCAIRSVRNAPPLTQEF